MSKIKNIIKKDLTTIVGKSANRLHVKTEYISFDIFDTLVFRNCEKPEDVFKLINRENPGYYKARLDAENVARQSLAREEITLQEIYNQLEHIYGVEEATRLKNLEIRTEISLCTPNHEMIKAFYALISQGKTVFLISDMYLPSQIVQSILDRCGINGYKKLYVSSEYNRTKRSGSLFTLVLKENGISSSQLTHIGDHPISDYIKPKKLGIEAFLYRRKLQKSWLLRDIKAKRGVVLTPRMKEDYDILRRICLNSETSGGSLFYLAGNQVLGPMLYGFSYWLHERVLENHIERLVFLAREGRILRDSYLQLFGDQGTEIEYINVSRLALCRANLIYAADYSELVKTMASLMKSVSKIGEFLALLGIKNKTDCICMEINCAIDDSLDVADKNELYDAIMLYGRAYFETQNLYLKMYLREHNIENGHVCLVDIGWSGTMQFMLSRFFPSCSFTGYYVAVSSFNTIPGYEKLDRQGYWCNADEWETKGKIFRFATSAIEELCMSDEGTTLEYAQSEAAIIPVKDDESITEEVKSISADLRLGLMDFLKTARDMLSQTDPYVFMWPYMNLAIYPSSQSVATFQSFTFINGVHKNSLLPEHSLTHYTMHPREAKAELEENVNKVLWFKSLLKIPLPYFDALCFMTDYIGMKSNYQKSYFDNRKEGKQT